MEHSNQSHEPRAADSELPKGDATTYPGGYHSRGVPGEEGDASKRMRVLKVGDRSQRINKSRPQTGGTGAEQASAAQLAKAVKKAKWADGARLAAGGATEATAAFVIAKKGRDFLDTPVFHAGESGEEEAVALFTDRQRAQQYLERAAWGQTDEIGALSPSELLQWLVEANGEGIHYVTINPDRERHLAGDPQPALSLDAVGEKSPDSLLQELKTIAQD